MLTFSDLTANLARFMPLLSQRFPHIEFEALNRFGPCADTLVEHVAIRHDLTPIEAREEISDMLFVESLARQASDLRAG